jgi:hypothetical protein
VTTTLPLVTLPPPSPALVLHEAAARLRPAAEAALARWGADGHSPERWYDDMDNALGGPVGVFCGLLSPELALELCDFLDATAAEAVRQARAGGTQEAVTDGYPTTIARRILEAK